MWNRLASWLDRAPRSMATGSDRRIATAVLMVEAARADFDRSPQELNLVRDTLAAAFDMPADEAGRLVSEAVSQSERAISLHGFVSELNRELDASDKANLIGWLWQIAHADGRVDVQEEAMIRRMADLLYVPHSVLVRQRIEAEER